MVVRTSTISTGVVGLFTETLYRDRQMLAVATDRRPFRCCLFLRSDSEFVTLNLIQGYLYASADNEYDGFWFNTCLVDDSPPDV